MRLTPIEPWTARKIGQAGQAITRADIEAYQLDRLRATLRLVREKSRFYRKLLATVPVDLSSLADVAHLPFTTADDIRDDPLGFLCVSQDEIERVVTLDTSGTSGKPKRIYFTRADQERIIEFFCVGMSTFTEHGDRVLILLPGETPGSIGDLLALALDRLDAVGIKHGPVRDPASALAVLHQEQIDVIVGLPTHVLSLVRHPHQPGLRLKSALLVSDYVPDAIKWTVEAAWGCAVFNHYGMTEMGLAGGVECEAHHGYHFREVDLFVEVVNPATGDPVPDGAYGEVVFSTLTREGMPLIRYRTGDVSRFVPGRCPCVTCLKSLERITHRLNGLIQVDGHTLTMADLDEALFSVDGVLDFSAKLARDGENDVLELAVEAQSAAADTLSEAIRARLTTIPACQPDRLQINVLVLTGETSALRTMGKRAIVDERSGSEGCSPARD